MPRTRLVLHKPLQWGQGWNALENEDAAEALRALLDASMGPGLECPGKPRVAAPFRLLATWLQWGQGWNALENHCHGVTLDPMQILLQWGQGWNALENTGKPVRLMGELVLQWGQGWNALENQPDRRAAVSRHSLLQWGQGWNALENTEARLRAGSRPASFNGARAGMPWKTPRAAG